MTKSRHPFLDFVRHLVAGQVVVAFGVNAALHFQLTPFWPLIGRYGLCVAQPTDQFQANQRLIVARRQRFGATVAGFVTLRPEASTLAPPTLNVVTVSFL